MALNKKVSLLFVLILITALIIGFIKFYYVHREDDLVVYASLLPSEEKAYKQLLKTFRKETKLRVKLVSQKSLQIKQEIEAEVNAGSGVIDIFEADIYYLQELAPYTEPLNALKSSIVYDSFYPNALAAGTFDKTLTFLPHRLSCQAMIYNSDYIKTPPQSWGELIKITDRYPRKLAFKAALYEGLVCDIFPLIWSMDGDLFDLYNPGTVKALGLIKKLERKINPGSVSFNEQSIVEAQSREEVYIHFNWPSAVTYLQEHSLLPTPNKTAPMPGASILGGEYFGISKAAPHKENALTFLKFIARKDAQLFLLKNLGWFPTHHGLWNNVDVNTQEILSGFIASLPEAKIRPKIENYERLSSIWQKIFHSLVFRQTSVQDIQEKYQPKLAALNT